MSTHEWHVGARPRTGAALEVDCHRLLRGPYTGVGTLLRRFVPEAHERFRDLVHRHAIEILSIAPELRATVDAPPETLASVSAPEEQTRIYPALRTRRLSHGIVDFLAACGAPERFGRLELVFTNLDEADHTDQECLSLLLRRIPSDRARITVHTRGDSGLTEELTTVLSRHARRLDVPVPTVPPDDRDAETLLQAYIDADGTSADPAELAAYTAADPVHRAALHDKRAAELRERDEITLTLGAIPYHVEHGSDPAGAGGDALLEALQYAVSMGFHHAVIDYGARGRAIVDPKTQMDVYWPLTGRSATALAATGRPEMAEPLYMDVRRRYAVPMVHLVNSYAIAMLYTRHYGPERRDYVKARTYVNTAIAIATLLPDPVQRAFLTAFNSNGLALIEMREGNLEESLRIVAEGLELVSTAVPEDTHRLHRSVLVYNMASLQSRMGRLEEALDGYTAVLVADPNWQDYYFERADVRRRLGDLTGALADYDAAELVTPPFWELHFNRGGLRAEVGDFAGAVADLERVVDLEPGEVQAWANLLAVLLESGDVAGALRRADDALHVHPDEPWLLCLSGQIALEAGAVERAARDVDAALVLDGDLVEALACRAGIAFDRGDAEAAVRDLSRAIELSRTDPDLYFNRAEALRSEGRWDAAIGDYTRALELPGADRGAILAKRADCYGAAGDPGRSRADLAAAQLVRTAEPALS
ncbi:tetratricopeptide repeat protein [Lentzea sp. NPDC059081]|uniref:tetratricopeptide repeat protein n=1 Tax=Lentzea sp. NPDC059081 TaxID=3346719 RepID=UPI003691CACA